MKLTYDFFLFKKKNKKNSYVEHCFLVPWRAGSIPKVDNIRALTTLSWDLGLILRGVSCLGIEVTRDLTITYNFTPVSSGRRPAKQFL